MERVTHPPDPRPARRAEPDELHEADGADKADEAAGAIQAAGTGEAAGAPELPDPSRLSLGTQLFRFVATGGLSAVVDYGLLVLGMALGLQHALAKAISWVFGTLTAYAINSRWTFQSGGSKRKLAAVIALYVTTFVLQVGTFALIFPPLESWWGTAVAQVVGFVIAQGIATTVNFIVQRALIFR